MPPAKDHEPDGAGPLSLRAARPQVVRLSRRVLIGAAGVAALGGAGVVAWGMLSRSVPAGPAAEVAAAPPPPERVSALPRDYMAPRDAPRLGPPLPGDLGRPILASQSALPTSSPEPAPPGGAGAQDVAGQEREAARTSHLFGVSGQAAVVLPEPPATHPLSVEGAAASASAPSGGGLLDAAPDRRTVSPDRLAPPVSPYALQAGAVIPAALVTGIRSDLPGEVIGQVTQDVYDSVAGRYLLVPVGSRLIGRYDIQVTFGQTRLLLAWTRLLLPNGRSIVLETLPGSDPSGFAGLQDQVDHHWRTLIGAAAVTSLLSVGTEVESTGSENDLATALRRAGADSANQVGQQVVGKALSVPPTLIIRPGMAVRVILTRDLILEPYGS